jgi:hypothetical protein
MPAASQLRTDPREKYAKMKARQISKIMELRAALVDTGFHSLDEQARVLGLSRSTTWTILRTKHKTSGLSAMIIARMLSSPELPALVRNRILQYVDEKATGLFGHTRLQRQRFAARLSGWRPDHSSPNFAPEYHQSKTP